MLKDCYDLVIIGGGPAGLASALGAYNSGIKDILIIERDERLGGILNQCIHNGFGLHRFKEELTGPEYASRYIRMVKEAGIEFLVNSMVIDLDESKNVTVLSLDYGLKVIQAKALILAMGCRERSRGAIFLPGDRCAGIYTAGTAQKYCNIDGYLVGKKVVILGSGDIGLIMARRLTLEGAKVLADVEICSYSNGLNRNIVQCLNDFDIPLYLGYTVSNVIASKNHKRVKEVIISKVDENKKIIPNTEISFKCDTLLLSVGLIPENELSKNAGVKLDSKTKGPLVSDNLETSIDGIFACGNVLQVHDLVDNVSKEGEKAGIAAAKYIQNEMENSDDKLTINISTNISYTCPQFIDNINNNDAITISFRVRRPINNGKIVFLKDGMTIKTIKKIKIIPSEMENLTLKRSDLYNAKNLSLEIYEESL